MIDDLLDARDNLDQLLDQALPALAAHPNAEAAEVLAVLLVAPLRRTGPDERMRRLVVRGLEQRATPEAAAVLAAIAALADDGTAVRATGALHRLTAPPTIEGIGATAIEHGWTVGAPAPAEAMAAVVRRPGEPGPRLLKLWLEPGGLLAGGWTEPEDDRRLERERERFVRMAGGDGDPAAEPLDAAATVAELDRIVRRTAELGLPLAEGVALIIAQLRRASGGPDWPAFDVVAVPEAPKGSARPGKRRGSR